MKVFAALCTVEKSVTNKYVSDVPSYFLSEISCQLVSESEGEWQIGNVQLVRTCNMWKAKEQRKWSIFASIRLREDY